jgi:hypothetical protein
MLFINRRPAPYRARRLIHLYFDLVLAGFAPVSAGSRLMSRRTGGERRGSPKRFAREFLHKRIVVDTNIRL